MQRKPLLSVLICTLEDRREMLKNLLCGLQRQIDRLDDPEMVEIMLESDQGQRTTGAKRNRLLASSRGLFSAFIDDDDAVSPEYIPRIMRSILRHPIIDVFGFFGEVRFSCGTRRIMMHSLMCPEWTEDDEYYYRPPNHLNPIRTELAQQINFRDITISEDHHWTIEMAQSGLLKREVFLGGDPMYYYQCREPMKGL